MRAADVVLGLVAVVQRVVDEGHYENYPSGVARCEALDGRACDCGYDEAKAALDAYKAYFGAST